MNLFILSLSPREAAMWYMDKHVSKILLEAVQVLCTAKRQLDPDDPENDLLYRPTHANHPVSVWVRQSRANYDWALDLVDALHDEWRFRYGHPATKTHKSYLVAQRLRARAPDAAVFPQAGRTPFAQAMPEEYKREGDAVAAYRAYYQSPEKLRLAAWKRRGPPDWWTAALPGPGGPKSE